MNQAKVYRVNGPVVTACQSGDLKLMELVKVGSDRLLGEVIDVSDERAVIQVYDDTEGLYPGESIEGTGHPLAIELGPGLLGNIFDGVGRPLNSLLEMSGEYIRKGVEAVSLSRDKKWQFTPIVRIGDTLESGSVAGEIQETRLIKHTCLIPPDVRGKIVRIAESGTYSVNEIMLVLDTEEGNVELPFFQIWPVKKPRPVRQKLTSRAPLLTGERVIDTFFPICRGGTAVIPGGFGTGKTMTQHALAKWSDADIIVYIGCGERGNEITEVLDDFPKLLDAETNIPLIERTVIIANTSNMPVAAREASIYTGITIAEYYRDMGFHVAVMADSTSRWAEALREISGRLEEMPAEGGFPSYLPSRLADFYERAGLCSTMSKKQGSVSIIGAVSPPGGDFSEPVTQNSLRFTRCFWALDRALASARHYPAINWIESYSEYSEDLLDWFKQEVGEDFPALREWASDILQEEKKLEKIVKLVGAVSLPEEKKLILESARLLREGYLQQNSFEPVDMYASMEKQYCMLSVIEYFHVKAQELVNSGVPVKRIAGISGFSEILRIKNLVSNDEIQKIEALKETIGEEMAEISKVYEL